MLLRRQFINKLLRDLLILICLLTLTGFLNTLGYDMTTIFTYNVIILTVFGLSFLYALYSRQRRQVLVVSFLCTYDGIFLVAEIYIYIYI